MNIAGQIQEKVPLAPYTTFGIGGPADFFVVVDSVAALQTVLKWAQTKNQPVLVLGGGSNVLISDDGFRGLVIKNEIDDYAVVENEKTVEVFVGAAMGWDELVAMTVAEGWWGIENLAAIPGNVGASPIQNIGAYGVEVQDVISNVEAVHVGTGEKRVFTNDECAFSYRHSFFKTPAGKAWVVTGVTFTLSLEQNPQLEYADLAAWRKDCVEDPSAGDIYHTVTAIRTEKFPDWEEEGTAGSFFKNPIIPRAQYESLLEKYPELPGFPVGDVEVKVPLGYILDQIFHLKGFEKDGVRLYEKQALVVVAKPGTTAQAVEDFVTGIAAVVYDQIGISIEWEVTKVG